VGGGWLKLIELKQKAAAETHQSRGGNALETLEKKLLTINEMNN